MKRKGWTKAEFNAVVTLLAVYGVGRNSPSSGRFSSDGRAFYVCENELHVGLLNQQHQRL